MLTYDKLRRNPRKFLALTGLAVKEFNLLLPAFEQAYERQYPSDKTRAGEPRQRKAGGGRKGSLDSVPQKLLFALVYQKAYPVQELMGEVFDPSQSRANRWVHQLLPVLKQALDEVGVLPERDPRQLARHERRKRRSADLIIDGTERRRQQPTSPEKQALHYSGKKKTHSDKHVVIVEGQSKRIGSLSQTDAGKTHDK